jgi:hypothetical protein
VVAAVQICLVAVVRVVYKDLLLNHLAQLPIQSQLALEALVQAALEH